MNTFARVPENSRNQHIKKLKPCSATASMFCKAHARPSLTCHTLKRRSPSTIIMFGSTPCTTTLSAMRFHPTLLFQKRRIRWRMRGKHTCSFSVRNASAVSMRIGITLPRKSHRLDSCDTIVGQVSTDGKTPNPAREKESHLNAQKFRKAEQCQESPWCAHLSHGTARHPVAGRFRE